MKTKRITPYGDRGQRLPAIEITLPEPGTTKAFHAPTEGGRKRTLAAGFDANGAVYYVNSKGHWRVAPESSEQLGCSKHAVDLARCVAAEICRR